MTQAAAAPRPVALGPWPQRMVNPIQPYDWGSTTALARMQGRTPTGAPEAELWMGAHPSAPSGLEEVDGTVRPLDALVTEAAESVLGADVAAIFGARLPFLLKVLAVDKPLSLQVHPTAERAAAAYAGEADAPGDHRYVDPFHKPELAYALEPTDILCGFRPADDAAYLLGLVDCERIRTVAAPLLAEDADDVECVEEAFRLLVTWPEDDREALAADVAEQAKAILGSLGPHDPDDPDSVGPDARRALVWASRLAKHHPGDPLVAAPFLLELVRLEPGHTLFVPAGAPHAYLYGLAVEIMANSDNVLRAGLTHKAVAVEELLTVVDGATRPVLDVPSVTLSPHETAWRPPVADFQLTRLAVSTATPVGAFPHLVGPQVVLCTQGPVTLSSGPHEIRLEAGQSAFVGAGGAPLTIQGPGEVFRAATGLLPA
ncbi:mannose-6-phosphate isomerase, class I [Kineosporia sp. A_224]|uniref:mannose-6-phosphate isomerase, class I n=1 Tax=Kineosporia sp. A_224 TaxID=1962180 RepID=UPI000B4BCE96|nr:mannose-6-phosphate isomerase, class I [Kineosporia sp. A_224]